MLRMFSLLSKESIHSYFLSALTHQENQLLRRWFMTHSVSPKTNQLCLLLYFQEINYAKLYSSIPPLSLNCKSLRLNLEKPNGKRSSKTLTWKPWTTWKSSSLFKRWKRSKAFLPRKNNQNAKPNWKKKFTQLFIPRGSKLQRGIWKYLAKNMGKKLSEVWCVCLY